MDRLITLTRWTHCKNVKGKPKVPALGLGKDTKCLPYETARSNANKEIAGSPYYGYVFGKRSDYLGIDVDVDPEGKKYNATTVIPPLLLFFLKTNPTHAHYSPNGHGLHLMYRLSKEVQKKLIALKCKQGATSSADIFRGDWRFRSSFLIFTTKEHEASAKEIAYISFGDICTLIPSILSGRSIESMSIGEGEGEGEGEVEVEVEGEVEGEITETEVVNAEIVEYSPQIPIDKITQVPTVEQLKDILSRIPSTFDYKAQQACEKLPYAQPHSNYDYWLLVGCGCAHHGVLLTSSGRPQDLEKVVDAFHEWSKKDTEGYTGEEAVIDKFNQLYHSTVSKIKNNETFTTIGVLSFLAQNCILNFPRMRKTKTGLVPVPGALENIKALIEYEGLELLLDTMGGGYCFKGPKDTIERYFCMSPSYDMYRPDGFSQVVVASDLTVRLLAFMQDNYGSAEVTPVHAKSAFTFLAQAAERTNAFKSWIVDVPWDGVPRLTDVCDTIEISEEYEENTHHYREYIRKSLMSLVGIHFWREDSPTINAILVLTGTEYTYKSFWVWKLIPESMKNYKSNVAVGDIKKGGKDWFQYLCSNAIVRINECEPLFTPKYEQALKSSIDQESDTYREVYGTTNITRARTALMIGTTNKSNLFTGSLGTRKVWQIPVKACDTKALMEIDMQQVYAEVYSYLVRHKEENPSTLIQECWAQSSEERTATNDLNAEAKGNDIGVTSMLTEVFGDYAEREFSPSSYLTKNEGLCYKERYGYYLKIDNNPIFWTARALFNFLVNRFENEMKGVKVDKVMYALKEYSGRYTKTNNASKNLFKDCKKNLNTRAIIIKNGRLQINKTTHYYIMPEMLEMAELSDVPEVDIPENLI